MRILSYEASGGSENELHFSKIEFGKFNLVVGNSGSGKTRLLNTIFNAGRFALHRDRFFVGYWDITLEHDSKKYHWKLETGKDGEDDDQEKVLMEYISIFENDDESVVVDRTSDNFIFNGDNLPKLSPRESSISLLQDEDKISPIYKAFSFIMRRNFSGSELENEGSYQAVPQDFFRKIEKTKNLKDLFSSNLNLSCKLYILSKFFKKLYENICKEFKDVFPFISEVEILDADQFGLYYPGIVPVFSLKEKFNEKWIPLREFSSGMKKVLLILSDVLTIPEEGCVYLIDEYENSLGVNAINFFPSILTESSERCQYIVTSHHPYIIGNAPVKNWILLYRRGNIVSVEQGDELEKKFGKSKQKAFIQLLNSPEYVEGVE
jgi:AAA15 family ATPase/GTPase